MNGLPLQETLSSQPVEKLEEDNAIIDSLPVKEQAAEKESENNENDVTGALKSHSRTKKYSRSLDSRQATPELRRRSLPEPTVSITLGLLFLLVC